MKRHTDMVWTLVVLVVLALVARLSWSGPTTSGGGPKSTPQPHVSTFPDTGDAHPTAVSFRVRQGPMDWEMVAESGSVDVRVDGSQVGSVKLSPQEFDNLVDTVLKKTPWDYKSASPIVGEPEFALGTYAPMYGKHYRVVEGARDVRTFVVFYGTPTPAHAELLKALSRTVAYQAFERTATAHQRRRTP